MASLTIRRLDSGDAEAVWRVHEDAFRASPLTFVEDAPADDDLRSVESQYLDAGGVFLVGTLAGEVVATGGYLPESEDCVEIRRMRVDPDHQGNGYGRRVLERLEARAIEEGYARAVLETHERLSAARALYEDAGYETVGERSHPATDATLYWYAKRL